MRITLRQLLLKEVFDFDNSFILKAKSERVDKQYYVDFSVSQEDVKNSIIIAEEFISELNNLIETFTEEKIKDYKNKAMILFS